MEHNWLQAYLIESIDKRLCTSIYCTTCGAQEFRHGLLDAVARTGCIRYLGCYAPILPLPGREFNREASV